MINSWRRKERFRKYNDLPVERLYLSMELLSLAMQSTFLFLVIVCMNFKDSILKVYYLNDKGVHDFEKRMIIIKLL